MEITSTIYSFWIIKNTLKIPIFIVYSLDWNTHPEFQTVKWIEILLALHGLLPHYRRIYPVIVNLLRTPVGASYCYEHLTQIHVSYLAHIAVSVMKVLVFPDPNPKLGHLVGLALHYETSYPWPVHHFGHLKTVFLRSSACWNLICFDGTSAHL